MIRGLPYPRSTILVVLAAFALVGCGGNPGDCDEDPTAPDCIVDPLDAALRVAVSTTGEDFDLSAYRLIIGQDTSLSGLNVSPVFTDLDAGDYTIRLEDVADNCSISGGATRQSTLTEGDTVDVAFAVTCTALPPATVDVTGTWTGQTIQGQEFAITYVLQQTGDDVTASTVDFVKPPGCEQNCAFFDTGVGRVSDSTFTLFVINLNEAGVLRLTTIHAVSGNQMAGSQTAQLCCFSATLVVTKQ